MDASNVNEETMFGKVESSADGSRQGDLSPLPRVSKVSQVKVQEQKSSPSEPMNVAGPPSFT